MFAVSPYVLCTQSVYVLGQRHFLTSVPLTCSFIICHIVAWCMARVQRSKVPLCMDSKLYYERYRPYSLIDGELAASEADDSSAVDQQVAPDADDQLMLTEDSMSVSRLLLIVTLAAFT